MTESRIGTLVDGLEVIADEPTQWESIRDGKPHTVESVRSLLLSDGTERYACADCDYLTTNQRAVYPHRKKHTGKAARRKAQEKAAETKAWKAAIVRAKKSIAEEQAAEATKPLREWTVAETLAAIGRYVDEIQNYTLADLVTLFENADVDWKTRALEAEKKVEQFRKLLH